MWEAAMDSLIQLVWELATHLKLVEKTEVECCGVTPYQGYLLMQLLESGPASMQDLSRNAGVAVSTMTRNIDKLEEKGLAKRTRSGPDARVAEAALTPAGVKTALKVRESWADYFARVSCNLNADEKSQVLAGLRALIAAIKKAGNCCK